MAGETVVLLWGLFDDEMYVEFDGEKFGPYRPIAGPVPLHRYRAFKRGKADERADRIRALADQLDLPISALAGSDMHLTPPAAAKSLPHQRFNTEAHAYHFAGHIAAKLAIADDLARPLAKLTPEDRAFIGSNRNARPRSASACSRRAYQYEPSFAVSVSRRPWNASRFRRIQAHLQIM